MTEREDLLENVDAVLRYDNEDVWEVLQSVRDYLKAQEQVEARLNLCDSCKQDFGGCSARGDDITFGCGIGNDNVVGCREYVNRWKAQEPVEPISDEENYILCGHCKHNVVGIIAQDTGKIIPVQRFCAECGKEIKWNG